jgi:hypothetical protein
LSALRLALTTILVALSACAAPEKQREFVGVPGEQVKLSVLEVLRLRGYSLQENDFRDFVVKATSPRIEQRGIFGSNGYTWHEIIVTAREYQTTPVRVDLLVQAQVWRQPPLGNKEMVKNTFTSERLEGEAALQQLDRVIERQRRP